jgi:CHAT domain-containing protein
MEDGDYVEDRLTDTTVAQSFHLSSKVTAEAADSGALPQRAMVVLNSCQTGRLTPGLTHLGGFADAFLDAGAGVFISSLWSIGDNPAELFMRELYTALLDDKTLAEATVAAREACSRDADGDATWLAYVVYGNPCAKFAH